MRLAYKWQVLISVIFGTFMAIMDTTVVNVALPKLQEVFGGGDLSQTQWIVSGYTMALGIVTPLSGYLADRFGVKRVYVTGLALFTISSALCAIAPNLGFLVLFRVLQGLGGGSLLPLGTALLFRAFPLNERGTAFGFFGIALVAAPALGPILSGTFVEYLDWRLIFLINVPIGLAGVLVGARFLREEKAPRVPALDGIGVITSAIAFGLILYAFSVVNQDGWDSPQVIIPLAIGVVSLVAFLINELRRRESLVDLRLYKMPSFLIGNIVGWVSVIALFGAEFLFPLYLQVLRGQTALQTGLYLLPLALTSGFFVPIVGKLSDKFGPRPLVVAGFLLLMVNTWQLTQLKLDTNITYIIVILAVRGVAFAMTIQLSLQAALRDVAPRELTRASALANASRQIFQSLGVAVLATIAANAAGKMPSFVAGQQPNVAALLTYKEHFLDGLSQAYTVTFFAALVAAALGLLLPGWPGKVEEKPVQPQLPMEQPEVAQPLENAA